MGTVVTTGTFDVPHMGHAAFLSKAKQLGDTLIVGVLSDVFVGRYKGQLPLYRQEERAQLINELEFVDLVGITGDQRQFFIEETDPDIIAVGSDWARKDYLAQIGMTQDELDSLEIVVAYVPYTRGISTTEIIERIK